MKSSDLIVSNSIYLKCLTQDDDETIYSAIKNNREFFKDWLPFVENTTSAHYTRSFIKTVLTDVEKRQDIYTVWVEEQFSGLLGIKEIDYLNMKLEIGYWLIESMTGKGIMTKCVSRILEFIFVEMKMNRVQVKCGVGNKSSSNIPKRLGFSLEGIERAGEKHLTSFVDLEVYSLLFNEWDRLS